MRSNTFIALLLLTFAFLFREAQAHEPLYGFGPHVLFKGGFARILLSITDMILKRNMHWDTD